MKLFEAPGCNLPPSLSTAILHFMSGMPWRGVLCYLEEILAGTCHFVLCVVIQLQKSNANVLIIQWRTTENIFSNLLLGNGP